VGIGVAHLDGLAQTALHPIAPAILTAPETVTALRYLIPIVNAIQDIPVTLVHCWIVPAPPIARTTDHVKSSIQSQHVSVNQDGMEITALKHSVLEPLNAQIMALVERTSSNPYVTVTLDMVGTTAQ